MNALAEYMQKFGLNDSSNPIELRIGQSFFDGRKSQYHTIRYDFIPASVDKTKTSALDFGEKSKVTVTVPNLEGTVADTTESVYQGSRKPHLKECLLIINNETGELVLEKLNTSVMVKKTRVRQEDLTGKSLALNRKIEQEILNGSKSQKYPNLISSSSTTTTTPPASFSSLSSSGQQPKLLPNKTSIPTTGSYSKPGVQQSRPGGIVLPTLSRNSKTPSPPSMPNSFGTNFGQKSSSSTFGSGYSAFTGLGATTAAATASSNGQTKTDKLSEDSSSDSSDDENDSSSSDSSSSDDESTNITKNSSNTISTQQSQPSMPSMPAFLGKSMPSFLGKSKEVSPVSTSNHSNRSLHSSNSPGMKGGSAKILSLSEDSDSDMESESWKGNNKSSNFKASMPSMPSSFGTKPAPVSAVSMTASLNTKVDSSVLSNDLQLSESSSDED